LIRLCEAKAKSELRGEATEEDAWDVIDIFRASLIDHLCKEQGRDIENLAATSSRGVKKLTERFLTAVKADAFRLAKSEFHLDQLKGIANRIGLEFADFDGFIEKLNHQGFLFKTGTRNILRIEPSGFSLV